MLVQCRNAHGQFEYSVPMGKDLFYVMPIICMKAFRIVINQPDRWLI